MMLKLASSRLETQADTTLYVHERFAASISNWIPPIADMLRTEQAGIGFNFHSVSKLSFNR